jgi:uncharacterized protein (DUF111 family)
MKKTRPGTLLSAICPVGRTNDIAEIILSETTTFGVRISTASRRCLERKWETVRTKYGDVRIKLGFMGDRLVSASPEYEDCKKAAESHGVPIRRVYDAAIAAYGARPG